MYLFRTLSALPYLVVGLLLSAPFVSASIPELPSVGFAKYQELGEDLFVGSIAADSHIFSDAGRLILSGRQRLDLKVSANRIYPRKLRNLFIQGAAVNNSPNSLAQNAEHMSAFAASLKGKLVKGDHLTFTFDGERDTKIFLNGIKLLGFESAGFFTVILNTWVGQVPPSTEFRTSILGLEDYSAAETQFALLTTGENRIDAVKAWVETKQEQSSRESNREKKAPALATAAIPAAAAISKASVETVSQVETAIEQAAEVISAAAPVKISEDESAQPEENAVDLAETPALSEQEALADTPDEPKTEIALNEEDSQLAAETSEPPTVSTSEVAVDEEPELDNSQEEIAEITAPKTSADFSADTILKSQIFAQELLRISRQEIAYPRRAQKLKQTGNVLANVTINREGKVADITLIDKTEYSALNKAVIKGIKKAEPYPEFPDQIQGQEFTFVVPVTFALR